MQCKDQSVWRSWLLPVEEAEHPEAVEKIRAVVMTADRFLREFANREVVVTSHRRERTGKPSYHWLAQAVDIRVHGMPEQCRLALIILFRAMRLIDPQIQCEPHEDLHVSKDPDVHQHDHIHVEVDNGALKGVLS